MCLVSFGVALLLRSGWGCGGHMPSPCAAGFLSFHHFWFHPNPWAADCRQQFARKWYDVALIRELEDGDFMAGDCMLY